VSDREHKPWSWHTILSLAIAILGLIGTIVEVSKNEKKTTNSLPGITEYSPYLGHNDSAEYVGMNACKQCHQKIYNTFIETGMGQSFNVASKEKSAARFEHPDVYDSHDNFRYHAFWKGDSLFFHEYRLEGKDTIHSRIEQVNYIIGSGQHTNSHIQNVNGYLSQMPMTFYTQKKQWDLPPGFENGYNTHFSRKIGLECMSCHNGFPKFVMGSENKYFSVPRGIDCERCHGPGSFHVQERQNNPPLDTSKLIDYSIVNPAKLSIERQFDICQRCHLQGNAVLKEGKSFYDFKPGKKLSDFISVFLPKYKNADDEFIMASHADRLKQSQCFIRSAEKTKDKNSLRPYKDAMTCVTCHNPHVSVRATNKEVFNDACNNCHHSGGKSDLLCTDPNVVAARNAPQGHAPASLKNCVNCHMPVSGSTDIPHVTVHDHYIRKPITKKEKDKIKTFLGLYSINEENPSALTKAKAYIQQYAKFDPNPDYLATAARLLREVKSHEKIKSLSVWIELHFIRQDFKAIDSLVKKEGENFLSKGLFTHKSYDNADAWSCYHVGEACFYTRQIQKSVKWFKQAVELAGFNLDFRNKLGNALASSGDMKGAEEQFYFIMLENPKYVAAYSNLGFIKLNRGFAQEALRLYKIGEKLDPDNEALLLNLAGFYALNKDKKQAVTYLNRILKKNPRNEKAKMALQQVNSML
jgi:tetratricopeptide (TPR) repeat protein